MGGPSSFIQNQKMTIIEKYRCFLNAAKIIVCVAMHFIACDSN